MSTPIYPKHIHHIEPKYLIGEDNSPDNLTPPISVALHAELHKDLYEHFGNTEDFIAWKTLSGQSLKGIIHTPEIRKKMSEANKGQIPWSKGKKIGPRSEEVKANMALLKIGKKKRGPNKKVSVNKGKKFGPRSEETKLKMSLVRIGKKRGPYKKKLLC